MNKNGFDDALIRAQRYQENRGFDGFGWSNRQY
jgi:hypothetical protein